MRYTRTLPTMTDASGDAAVTQKNFGRLLLCTKKDQNYCYLVAEINYWKEEN
jgi:hypothetical protein